eukprot:gene12886-13012_t
MMSSAEDLVTPESAELVALEFGKAGGITQHIGAFQVTMPGSGASITFLDTPGHAAFGAMRARGAAATDIVVLAVAADDGVMPQTREALAHAQAAQVSLVVALTKCDLPQARPAEVKLQLLSEGIELEEFGGHVQCVETAARAGLGLTELEEALLLQAEVMELKAPLEVPATAVVVEAQVTKALGPVATVIVRKGTLKPGDPIVVGTEHGRVRALRDSRNCALASAGPGQAVVVSGLKGVPSAGDELLVVGSEQRAIKMAAARSARAHDYRLSQLTRMQAEHTRRQLQMRELEYERAPASEVDAAIKAAKLEVLQHQVIYHLLDEVTACMDAAEAGAGAAAGMAEEVLGTAMVLQVFPLLKNRKEAGKVAGCRVQEGSLQLNPGTVYRVLREGQVVYEGPCSNLRQHKQDVAAVGRNGECGVVLDGGQFVGFLAGDLLQCVQRRTTRG